MGTSCGRAMCCGRQGKAVQGMCGRYTYTCYASQAQTGWELS
jgi:hypothetical protein